MLFAVISLSIVGCSNSADGLKPAQVQESNRLDAIAQKTGGDWNKLTPDDKAYLLKASFGSESTAKMLLLSRSGKFGVSTGAPKGRPKAPSSPGSPQ